MTSRWRGGFPTPALSLCFSACLSFSRQPVSFLVTPLPPRYPACFFSVWACYSTDWRRCRLSKILQKLQSKGPYAPFFLSLLSILPSVSSSYTAKNDNESHAVLHCQRLMSAWLSAWHRHGIDRVPVCLSDCLSHRPRSLSVIPYSCLFPTPSFLPSSCQTLRYGAGRCTRDITLISCTSAPLGVNPDPSPAHRTN